MSRYLVIHMTDPSVVEGEWAGEADIAALDDWSSMPASVDGSPVAAADRAKAVAVRHGETLVTDGPFPEFKEWFMGYDLIDADSMDVAVAIVARHPSAKVAKLYILPAVALPWAGEGEGEEWR